MEFDDPRLLVDFGIPLHGWLPVRLQAGEQVLEDSASAVLNNFLEELVLALEGLLVGRGPGKAWMWLEPPSLVFFFGEAGLEVRLFPDERCRGEGEVVFSYATCPGRLTRRFHTALHKLESQAKRGWDCDQPFPHAALKRLRRAIEENPLNVPREGSSSPGRGGARAADEAAT